MKTETKSKQTNSLIHETSPYLLQHAHNPVDWYPWSDEALGKAQKENKLLVISIGYAACHWCHVMEHESFEDSTVAAVMNQHYVSIKVDREERPDVDQVYMNAAYMVTGRGGWPLNAIALPDGRPVYVATYFPKDQWLNVLEYFAKLYEQTPDELVQQADKVVAGIHQFDLLPPANAEVSFTKADLEKAYRKFAPAIDLDRGGKSGAPKFPMPNNWDFLLRYYYQSNNKEALKAVTVTLDNMAYGGIYDQIGGGFARYSTDSKWFAPHFEKMLYDNGQLVSLYSDAYKVTKYALYKEVVYETLEFIERELTSPEGGFYSSLDADSEGEEGRFYVWTEDEIDRLLKSEADWFKRYYNVTPKGNWEHGKNIFYRDKSIQEFSDKSGISVPALEKKLKESKNVLMQARDQRIRPGLDDKILTSWNALMLKGYVDAYTAFKEARFLNTAIRNAEFLWSNVHREDGGLFRNHKNGRSTINGFLDDYAFTISAFIALYQATFDEQWLYRAKELTVYAVTHFSDAETGMFFYTSDEDAKLIARQKEMSDNVIPASNSEMAKNLFILGTFFNDQAYVDRSKAMLQKMINNVQEQPAYYSNWANLIGWWVYPPFEVAITGRDALEKLSKLNNNYRPDVFYLGGTESGTLDLLEHKFINGKTMIYVCKEKVCKLPVSEVPQALELLK